MTRSNQIKNFLIKGKLKEAMEAIHEDAEGTRHESTSIQLLGQYNDLERQITQGIVDDGYRRVNKNRLSHNTNSLLNEMEKEFEEKMSREVEVDAGYEQSTDMGTPYPTTRLPQGPLKAFVCYSRVDKAYQEQFSKYLKVMEMNGVLESWYDGEVVSGEEWDTSIKANLAESEVIFLLISVDFLVSEYVREFELPVAMEKHAAGTARVIPIILRDCPWKQQEFAKLQATNAKPVGEPVNDQAWLEIDKQIRRSLKKFQGN